MTINLSAFVKSIQRRLGDTSAGTASLLQDFANERLQDFCGEFNWSSLRDIVDFTTVGGTRRYTMTAWGAHEDEYDTDGVITIKEEEQGVTLKKMALSRYEELVQKGTSQTGYPTHYVPLTDTDFYLYPTPNGSIALTAYIRANHATLSADAMNFRLTNSQVGIVKFGVLADIYADKDDNRAVLMERRYAAGLKREIARMRKLLNSTSGRMLPGDSRE